MRNRRYILVWGLWLLVLASCKAPNDFAEFNLPPRDAQALPASRLLEEWKNLSRAEREERVLRELEHGNVPSYMRRLTELRYKADTRSGAKAQVSVWVLPDYFAIGSDHDFIRYPLTPMTAQRIADTHGFSLPTPKLVDLIYRQASIKLKAQSLPPRRGQVSSFTYISRHQELIQKQLQERKPGRLIAGHKKDIVLTRRLVLQPGRVAIYGWHRTPQEPIQPLSLVHHQAYVDYSHGLRMVGERIQINGEPYSIAQVLQDPELAPLVSYEGPLPLIRFPYARATVGRESRDADMNP